MKIGVWQTGQAGLETRKSPGRTSPALPRTTSVNVDAFSGTLRAYVHGSRSTPAGPLHKACRRVHDPGGAHNGQGCTAVKLAIDAIHFQRDFAEPDNMWPNARAACATRNIGRRLIDPVIGEIRSAAVGFAARAKKFAMHVEQALRSCSLVQGIDILRAKEESISERPPPVGQAQSAPDSARSSEHRGGASNKSAIPFRHLPPMLLESQLPRRDTRSTGHCCRERWAGRSRRSLPRQSARRAGPEGRFR